MNSNYTSANLDELVSNVMYGYYVKYDTLTGLINTNYSGSNATTIDIYIDMQDILRHIDNFESSDKKCLYRNLQHYQVSINHREKGDSIKIVYAGLLGVAQDMLGIIRHVDFKRLGVEFHLYGGGNQAKEIETYITEKDCNVFYHGYVSKDKIAEELEQYDASIVPLAVRIKGAVPSKIFDIR